MAFDPLEYEMRRNMMYGNRSSGSRTSSAGAGGATILSNFVDALQAHQDAQEKIKDAQDAINEREQAAEKLRQVTIQGQKEVNEHNTDYAIQAKAATPEGQEAAAKSANATPQYTFMANYNKLMIAHAQDPNNNPLPSPAIQAAYQRIYNDVNKIKPKATSNDDYDAASVQDDTNSGQRAGEIPAAQPPAPGPSSTFNDYMKNLFGAVMGKNPQAAQSAVANQSPSLQQASQGAIGTPGAQPPAQAQPATQAPKYVNDQVIKMPSGKQFRVIPNADGTIDQDDPNVVPA